VLLDTATCHAACDAKDRRFDGRFFVGVKSTGIYCRCVCTARTPKRENRTFHPSAAAAESAGFRPCLLCRPECAPGQSRVDATERLAHDAVLRIEAGALEEQGLESLAAELGVTDRHLRRVIVATFGAAPVELAQTHRLLTAKRLLRDTSMSMADVAFAAGFQSVRRFNTLFRERYGLTPSRVRGRAQASEAQVGFTLAVRGTFDGTAVLEHAALRAVTGVELVGPTPRSGERGTGVGLQLANEALTRRSAQPSPRVAGTGEQFPRTFAVGAHSGLIRLRLGEATPRLFISDGLMPAFRHVIAAVRGALDLDADLDAIHAHLRAAGLRDGAGVRIPGALDPFEVAVRAVLGQQVTVKAATTLASRLTSLCGASLDTGESALTHLFPTAERIAELPVAKLAALGQPRKRAETLHRLARAVADGQLKLARGAVALGREGLAAIPGIGPWTVEYVALRGLGDPDAFPLGDSALRAAFDGDLARASEAWRPWRAYAAARLWTRTRKERR